MIKKWFGVFIVLAFKTFAQSEFKITFNVGFGAMPTFSPYTDNQTLTKKEGEKLFYYLRDSIGLQWKYPYAGCEKRAHAASLFLKGRNVKHHKIWNFDPSMISMFHKQQQPTVNSKLGLNQTVSWRYHVAIIVYVKDGGEITPMVIDPAISDKIISRNEWLQMQNAANSFYLLLDPEWYNYATTDKFKYFCNGTAYNFPPCAAGLLTGDFFRNDGVSLSEMWVEEALSVNEQAVKIVDELIAKEGPSSKKRVDLTAMVESIDKITAILKGQIPADLKPYSKELERYQKAFLARKNEWKIKLDNLRK